MCLISTQESTSIIPPNPRHTLSPVIFIRRFPMPRKSVAQALSQDWRQHIEDSRNSAIRQ